MALKVLSIEARPLTPHRDGGSKRSFDTLSCFRDLGYSVDTAALFERSFPPYDQFLGESVKLLTDSGFNPIVQPLVAHLETSGRIYEIVLIGGPAVGRAVIPHLRKFCPHALIFYDTIDLAHRRLFQEAKATGNVAALRRALQIKESETASIKNSDAVMAVSADEAQIVNLIAPDIPQCIFPGRFSWIGGARKFDQTSEIVFLGSFTHSPNVDAIQFWNSEIGPRLKAKAFKRQLIVAGDNSEVLNQSIPEADFFRPVGYVASLRDFFSPARLFIAPLRFGAGIKTKLLQALAHGVPCITTPIGAEGIARSSSAMLGIASSADEVAAAIVRRYSDSALWDQGVQDARRLILSSFGIEVLRQQLKNLIDQARRQRQLRINTA